MPDGNAEHFPGPIHQPPLVANVDAIQPHEHAEHAHHPRLQHHFDDMKWTPPRDLGVLAAQLGGRPVNPPTDCSGCHR